MISGVSGNAAHFLVTNKDNWASRLYVQYYGVGYGELSQVYGDASAGRFHIDNSGIYVEHLGTSDAIYGTNSGTRGNAGYFKVTNSTNPEPGVYIQHAGIGRGLLSHMQGNASDGRFHIDNPANAEEAITAQTNGSVTSIY